MIATSGIVGWAEGIIDDMSVCLVLVEAGRYMFFYKVLLTSRSREIFIQLFYICISAKPVTSYKKISQYTFFFVPNNYFERFCWFL